MPFRIFNDSCAFSKMVSWVGGSPLYGSNQKECESLRALNKKLAEVCNKSPFPQNAPKLLSTEPCPSTTDKTLQEKPLDLQPPSIKPSQNLDSQKSHAETPWMEKAIFYITNLE